jgi:hypothetical protein
MKGSNRSASSCALLATIFLALDTGYLDGPKPRGFGVVYATWNRILHCQDSHVSQTLSLSVSIEQPRQGSVHRSTLRLDSGTAES